MFKSKKKKNNNKKYKRHFLHYNINQTVEDVLIEPNSFGPRAGRVSEKKNTNRPIPMY